MEKSKIVFEPQKYAALPFWFWNDIQTETEITRQMELAKEGELRGFAIHAREGNCIEYMSERWLNLCRHACREARRLGLEIWLYDEEGYPSGNVGGRLTGLHPHLRQKYLKIHSTTAADTKALERVVRVFPKHDPSLPVDPSALEPDTPVTAFTFETTNHWLVDALKRESIEMFLDMTHRIYQKELGEYFGNPITYVYTDDLHFFLSFANNIPYTETLEQTFREEHGYSILDNLAKILENTDESAKVRIDYRSTLSHMFCRNYVKPMNDWCERHGLKLTGHLSGDEGPFLLSLRNFSDAMPFYEYETVPGIDDFICGVENNRYLKTPGNRSGFALSTLCKQATSVASQLKNGLCSSEVLTSLGWGVPVRSQKAQIMFQYAMGINIIVPHDYSYATRGLTKRDHPASYFFQQPYFHHHKTLHADLSRSAQLLSHGHCDCPVLVIHPMTSMWAMTDGHTLDRTFDTDTAFDRNFYTDSMAELNWHLLRLHVDFEYGCEEIMSRHAKVNGNLLQIGEAAYTTVLLPNLYNLENKTVELLNQFAENDGRIIILGQYPSMIHGSKTSEDQFHFQNAQFLHSVEDLKQAHLPVNLEFTTESPSGAEEILLGTRLSDGKQEYYLVNYSGKAQKIHLKNHSGDLVLFDPVTGKIIQENGACPDTFLLTDLASCHLLPSGLIDADVLEIRKTPFAPEQKESIFDLACDWTVSANAPNVFMIDAAYTRKQDRFRFTELTERLEEDSYFAKFNLPAGISCEMTLFQEPDNIKLLRVNGQTLSAERFLKTHHRATQDLLEVNLAGLLKEGENILEFKALEKQIEMFYLCGQFNVELNGVQSSIRRQASPGFSDAAYNGYPFYWGTLRYETEFDFTGNIEDIFLHITSAEGIVKVELNGMNLGLFWMPEFRTRLTPALKQGKNKLVLELDNTAENFFGPHREEDIRKAPFTGWQPNANRGHEPACMATASFGIYKEPCFTIIGETPAEQK